MNRLKFLRNEKKKTLEDIANFLNVTLQTISNYENEKRDMSPTTIIKLAQYFNVSTDYLLGKTDIRNSELSSNFKLLPVYGQISAGVPNWAVENIEGHLPVDIELMKIDNLQDYFFLHVKGESMNKIVKNDAFALIHKQDTVENGEIAVVLVNGYDATLKKFTKQNDLIILEPQSTDSNFQTQVYDKKTNIKILGKYIGKMELE